MVGTIWYTKSRMTVIKTKCQLPGIEGLEDKELPSILSNALGMSLRKFVEVTLDKVEKEVNLIGGERLDVSCYKTEKLGKGWCGKYAALMSIGFCGDIKDFETTLIHELLHFLNWDEMMIESKAKEIYKSIKNGHPPSYLP